jgi:hypothetical protein
MDEVALYNHEMSDDGLTQAWWLQAHNIRQPGAGLINLFIVHMAV